MIPSIDPNANKSTNAERNERFRNLTQRADGNTNNLQHVTHYDFETNILPTLITKFQKKKFNGRIHHNERSNHSG